LIGILDYGMGNLASVERAFRHLGASVRVQDHLEGIDKLVIPGVGAFAKAMEQIKPLKPEIQKWASSGQPLMGICLGEQLLFETSEELQETVGLEILPGRVRYFEPTPGIKIPHMGWNTLDVTSGSKAMSGVQPGDQVYFVHSLYVEASDPQIVAATSVHGTKFVAAVEAGSVWGTQFHPEKSGEVGLNILNNFILC
jgi:glutamine amidotransferase